MQDALVLTHGAGGNSNAPLLIEIARVFEAAGFAVLRYDLPFRQKRASGSPHPSGAAADRAGLKEAAESMRARAGGRLLLGGQSYGGRQATMLAAEDPSVADALLLLSYPLHPPGKPEQLRTQHFATLRTPSLFVHGDRDPFGSPDELRDALKLLAGPSELIVIAGAGHDLKRGKWDASALPAKARSI